MRVQHRADGGAEARRRRHPPLLRAGPPVHRAVLKGQMRISYEWLGDFVDLDGVTAQDAADVLTRQGVEVESLTMVDLSQIVIGKVLEQTKHPKSRNDLWIHLVDLGDRKEQIIAGAPNAIPGSLVPVALPGTTVPSGKVVKDMNIAGFRAAGMLCSAAELLLGDDHAGILVLDRGTPGQPLTTVIPSQAVMEAEVTSNRPDCMGHLGIARELAAGLDRPMKRDFMPAFTGTADPAGTEATADILLESATFSGPSVRQTSRALGLRTEASARFERALPPELALAGARRAASLIAEIAGGQVHRDWADVYPRPQEPVRVNIRPALIDDVLGTHVPLEEAESILKRLNFHVKVMSDGDWDVLPPVFRLDVTIPEDLVEEVGRVYGYDRVPPTRSEERRVGQGGTGGWWRE